MPKPELGVSKSVPVVRCNSGIPLLDQPRGFRIMPVDPFMSQCVPIAASGKLIEQLQALPGCPLLCEQGR